MHALLANGAKVDVQDDDGTTLGANVGSLTTVYDTALHTTTESDHVTVVHTLLTNGADPNAKNKSEWSAFQLAAWHGKVTVRKKEPTLTTGFIIMVE